MDILKKINQLRINRNWSVYRLSVEAGLPQSTITNMFNRETLPSIVTLQSICNAFGITLSEFFKEEKNSDGVDYEQFERIYNELPGDIKISIFNLMKNIVDSQ
ncbi:MAG: helix-turn-helix transcriptional regulator [Firmicutes bacterium]|nr:helix-turn-helix transcriptional regulator [Bacillota bacterium]